MKKNNNNENEFAPFFADKSIVGDYRPLYNYWKILKDRNMELDRAMLRPEDFEYIRELIKYKKKISLAELIENLTSRFIERLDCRIAREALRLTYDIDVSSEYACRKIAEILAGWLVEAANNTGILKIKHPWRRS